MRFGLPIAFAAAGALFLSGCEPTTEDNVRTQTGIAAGALVGSVVGATAGGGRDRLARTVVGAGIGAAAGGMIGAQLDRQAAELRRDLGNDVSVVNTGSQLVVTMPQDILFAVDSATLRPDLRRDLQSVSANLQRYPDSTIRVIGHTDNTGSASYNQTLSERRASAVASELLASGVNPRRIVATGMGENQPVASNLTPEGRAQNRRVEIVIIPTA